MSLPFRWTQKGEKRTQRSAFTTAASKIGMTFEQYMSHFDAGERWCGWHQTWEAKEIFYAQPKLSTGVSSICRAAYRERSHAAKRNTI